MKKPDQRSKVILIAFLSWITFNLGLCSSLSFNTISYAFAQVDNPTLSNTSPLGNEENISKSNLTSISQVLPSWNQSIVKERIVNFVKNVTTDPESSNYISPEDRIAVFDNDGTMWSEKPIPFQGFFILDRLEELSKSNPAEIKQNPQIKQLLEKILQIYN